MTDRTPKPNRSRPGTGILRNPFVWAFLIGAVVLTATRPFLRFDPAPPFPIAQIPAWQLTDSAGLPFGSSNLAGRTYVASFFSTRDTTCSPLVMHAVAGLQRRYRDAGVEDVRLVSISMDPDHDTPQRLAEYAARRKIDPEGWALLTGHRDNVRAVVVNGFRTAMGRPEEIRPGVIEIAHARHLVLVDPQGRIRGYYGVDELGLDELFHRSRHVRDSYR